MDPKICDELARALGEARGSRTRSQGATTDGGDDRPAIIQEYCARYKISRGTAYRWAALGGYESGRAGAGGPKRIIHEGHEGHEEKLKIAAALIHQTASKKYPPKMSTHLAIQIGERSGFWQPGELTVDQVNRYMLDHCPRVPTCGMEPPAFPRRPDYVNQVGQFDVSTCAQFYLLPDGRVGAQDEGIYCNKNKSSQGGPASAIKRGVYTEVLTNSFYVEYFLGAESTENEVPILHRAWLPKGLVAPAGFEDADSKYPLQGMPEILIADKGSGLKNNYCEMLFENLGIDFRTHKRGNPRAKGSIETLMWFVECRIESLLRFEPASNIDDFNRLVFIEAVNVNGTEKHSRYDMPRSMAFSSWAQSEHLRRPPIEWEYFHRLGYRESEVRISQNLSFHFRGLPYTFLADSEYRMDPAVSALRGQTVTVMYSPFDKDRVRVRAADGREYFPTLIERDRYGYPNYAVRIKAPQTAPALATPIVVQNIEAAQQMDIAAVAGGAAGPLPVKAFAREDEMRNMRFMVRAGREFEEHRQDACGTEDAGRMPALPGLPRQEAKRRLQELLERKLTRDESGGLDEEWGQFVTEEEIRKQRIIHEGHEGTRRIQAEIANAG